jgi:hypothetical protein
MIIAPLGKLPFQTYPLFAEVGVLTRQFSRIFSLPLKGHRGRDHLVVGFTTTYM